MISVAGGVIKFDQSKILGKGGGGTVFEGVFDRKTVAIKRIEEKRPPELEIKEEEALKKLEHRNIIKLLHSESDKNFRYFVLELCAASLDQLFLKGNNPRKYKGPRPPKEDVIYQLANGLDYIHKQNYIHRDIKPENVLIWVNKAETPKKASTGFSKVTNIFQGKTQTSKTTLKSPIRKTSFSYPSQKSTSSQEKECENAQVLVKWADFGLSKKVNERGTFTMSGIRGTSSWFAPETLAQMLKNDLDKEETATARGTIESDIFSEGLVFGYFLSDGKHPFGSSSVIIPSKILEDEPNLPDMELVGARELIVKMLTKDPENRIPSSKVFEQVKTIWVKAKQAKLLSLSEGKHFTWEKFKNMIAEDFDVNCVNKQGQTPLMLLAKHQNPYDLSDFFKIINDLINSGLDIHCKDENGYNILYFLCRSYKKENLIDLIRSLVLLKIDLSCKTNDGQNLLQLLSQNYREKNLLDIFELLIKNGIELDTRDINGCNILLSLCESYHEDNLLAIVKLLLADTKKIDINCKNKDGWTALHMLCRHCQRDDLIDILTFLVESGININSRNKDGWTAFLLLSRHYKGDKFINIVKLFMQHQIEVNDKESVFLYLCRKYRGKNLIEIVSLFIERGVKVNSKDENGRNALHLLCKNSKNYPNNDLLEIVKLLIDKKINVKCLDRNGRNALNYLCLNYVNDNLIDIIRLLITNGSFVNGSQYYIQGYSRASNLKREEILVFLKKTNDNSLVLSFYNSRVLFSMFFITISFFTVKAFILIVSNGQPHSIFIFLVCLFFLYVIYLTVRILDWLLY